MSLIKALQDKFCRGARVFADFIGDVCAISPRREAKMAWFCEKGSPLEASEGQKITQPIIAAAAKSGFISMGYQTASGTVSVPYSLIERIFNNFIDMSYTDYSLKQCIYIAYDPIAKKQWAAKLTDPMGRYVPHLHKDSLEQFGLAHSLLNTHRRPKTTHISENNKTPELQ